MAKPINHKIRQVNNRKIIKPTRFGELCIIWSESNQIPRIDRILLSQPGLTAERQASELYPDSRISSCKEINAVASAINACLKGEDVLFNLDIIDFSLCTPFQQSVLRATYAIPRGRVSTYGLIAAHVGISDGARAVGNVMAGNPFPLIVPCHRVIRSDKHIGGYGGGVEAKRALLEREGIIFDQAEKVVCRKLYYD